MMTHDGIAEEQLEFAGEEALLAGVPFTGRAFRVYANGQLKREVTYKDGFENGECREWYDNGQMKCEWTAIHGRAEGKITEWHANGQVKSVVQAELGVRLSCSEWTEDGTQVRQWQLSPSSAQFRILQELRKTKRAE